MTERERLIELLKVPIYPRIGADPAEVVADYLLDHGVIVPPCKVGDTVYKILDVEWDVGEFVVYNAHYIYNDHKIIYDAECHSYEDINDVWFYDDDIGKTVFLTREEAEKALKARENDA